MTRTPRSPLSPLRRIGLALSLSAAALLLTPLGGAPAEAAPRTGTVLSGPLNIRAQPTTTAKVLRVTPKGKPVSLGCHTLGPAITGPYGVSKLWYSVTGGGWASDAFLETGSNRAVTPLCASSVARPLGATRAGNWAGDTGQCTWLAYEKAKQFSGAYPALTGNARDWAASARATGWAVSLDAQPNSIVVFQPGVHGAFGAGHVAWATKTQQRADGRYVFVQEMNFRGWRVTSERWVKDVPGMSFILLPPR
ncbi:CHAP domain-containing protein [Leucobacter sp. M11]|uniref:CHAP domain-containing protein n=1 Tax=Leucobacter sp. M11 TaxID=2993565 RepID=UPI002D7ED016|nr:CHAP domain-containing protein [Leucobacter sp. M11]MEB4613880.1 CHAP domain-containing protein [Leucobacter sp. M11]